MDGRCRILRTKPSQPALVHLGKNRPHSGDIEQMNLHYARRNPSLWQRFKVRKMTTGGFAYDASNPGFFPSLPARDLMRFTMAHRSSLRYYPATRSAARYEKHFHSPLVGALALANAKRAEVAGYGRAIALRGNEVGPYSSVTFVIDEIGRHYAASATRSRSGRTFSRKLTLPHAYRSLSPRPTLSQSIV